MGHCFVIQWVRMVVGDCARNISYFVRVAIEFAETGCSDDTEQIEDWSLTRLT